MRANNDVPGARADNDSRACVHAYIVYGCLSVGFQANTMLLALADDDDEFKRLAAKVRLYCERMVYANYTQTHSQTHT